MDGQTIIVALLVASAAVFIVRRAWMTAKAARAAKSGCAVDCGCEPGTKSKDWAD